MIICNPDTEITSPRTIEMMRYFVIFAIMALTFEDSEAKRGKWGKPGKWSKPAKNYGGNIDLFKDLDLDQRSCDLDPVI